MTSAARMRAPEGGAPVIGMSTYAVYADWTAWADHAVLTPRSYVDCLLGAGGVPLLLPPIGPEAGVVDALLDRVDAIVLVGGEDVCGTWSGRTETDEQHAPHSDERDAFEIAIAQSAWERDMPLLGICRGSQVLNVALGGTLIEDLPTAGASREHLLDRGTFNDHKVEIEPGSLGARLYGLEADVPSHHHQAIDSVGEGLLVTGRAPDGVVEIVEAADRTFTLGVQWHPEEGEDMVLFEALVEACGARA